MGKLYGKYPLETSKDIKRATASIYKKCRNLKHRRTVQKVFSKKTDDDLLILGVLSNCECLIEYSIIIESHPKFAVGYKRSITLLKNAIEEVHRDGIQNNFYRAVDIRLIANFLRYHTKSFRLLDMYKAIKPNEVTIIPENSYWEKALMGAIVIWPESKFSN